MTSNLYAHPFRVYILIALIAVIGIASALRMPVSLFPNSTKPEMSINIGYGKGTSKSFLKNYGTSFESELRTISGTNVEVEEVEASYEKNSVNYVVSFTWGSDPDQAKEEIESIVASWKGRLPEDMRDTVYAYSRKSNSGFFAASFYSDRRGTKEVHEILKSALVPKLKGVKDAEGADVWNPGHKEILIELKPEVVAALQLVPRDIESALLNALSSMNGGEVKVEGDSLAIELKSSAEKFEDLAGIPILTPSGKIVHLSDVAKIDLSEGLSNTQIIKTSGSTSVILFAAPKPGANVKRMSEDIVALLEETKKSLPADIQYKVLVDPSVFIRSAVKNVFHEVGIGALLAVAVLFVFIGSFKNIATAAIEIPLSIIMAFILMKMTGVTINLISLGGLALSAGMNVDGSVVVMENIFRHFEKFKGQVLSASEKLKIVTQAVTEVKMPLIASTIASLVVFVPLTFTSSLTYAVLGDLAKAVVYSHGLSAITALILVPTVRYHLLSREQFIVDPKPPFEKLLTKLETRYSQFLGVFVQKKKWQYVCYVSVIAALGLLMAFVLPRLPREVIGTPDSDMIFISMSTQGNTHTKQMETQVDEVEKDLLDSFNKHIDYTFTQIYGQNGASILAKLKDKGEMNEVWKKLEKKFSNTPTLQFYIGPWNPSELPIPDPPALRVALYGGDPSTRREQAQALSDYLQTEKVLDRIYANPDTKQTKGISYHLDPEQWILLAKQGSRLSPGDLAEISTVATQGKRIDEMDIDGTTTGIYVRYPKQMIGTVEDLAALPVGIGSKIIPLKSLASFQLVDVPPPLLRINGEELLEVFGRQNKSEKKDPAKVAKAEKLVQSWINKTQGRESLEDLGNRRPVAVVEDAGKDVTEAILQLQMAIGVSILLIFLVLMLQFGSAVESLLVLVAIPLGFIGVLFALWIAQSNLSLNSALGIILLNGIAVNNSILMVDFTKRLYERGFTPHEAAVEAARHRLRPILITTLTTILGMLPIALGMGEGGRILQPLGIAVSGGLWISTILTILIVPALHVSYLQLAKPKREAT